MYANIYVIAIWINIEVRLMPTVSELVFQWFRIVYGKSCPVALQIVTGKLDIFNSDVQCQEWVYIKIPGVI